MTDVNRLSEYDISDSHMDDPDFDPAIHLACCLIAIRGAHPLHTNSDICPICLPLRWSQIDFEGIARSEADSA